MTVKVCERILDLFEARGIASLFGIPDPNFVHLFHEAQRRGWDVVAPHHEECGGFMAEAVSCMTGKPGLCIGTLGPGLANLAGAMMCAKVENSPVIFLGGQRARVTEQRSDPSYDPNKCIFEVAVFELFPKGQDPQTDWVYSPADDPDWRTVLPHGSGAAGHKIPWLSRHQTQSLSRAQHGQSPPPTREVHGYWRTTRAPDDEG